MTDGMGLPKVATEPVLSIIIDNYNYGRFVKQAVDSALAQTYPKTEVIVVDDGSNDNSLAVIRRYGQRIGYVFKDNGGQASAFNAGFRQCHGEIVIFLDADDILLPDIGFHVVNSFVSNTGTAKVQYRLAIVDDQGQPTGGLKPGPHLRMPNGDMRQQVLAFPDDIPWAPTSGNAFAAGALRWMLPIPEHDYRICADFYLCNVSALCGTVVSLDRVGGYYRTHGSNQHYTPGLDAAQSRQIIALSDRTHAHVSGFARQRGLKEANRSGLGESSVSLLAHRITSSKLDPGHIDRHGARISFLKAAWTASLGRVDAPWTVRLAYGLWFTAMVVSSGGWASQLAELFFRPERSRFLLTLRSLLWRSG